MDSGVTNWDGTTLEAGKRLDEEGSTTLEPIEEEEERLVETLGAISDLKGGKEWGKKEGRTSEMADKGISKEVGKIVDNWRSKEGLSELVEHQGVDKGAGRAGKIDSWKMTCEVIYTFYD